MVEIGYMDIYSISINDDISEKNLEYWNGKISKDKRERVKKYRFLNDKKRSIYGELLLRYALKFDKGISEEKVEIEYINGKPHLKKDCPLFFNISHSDEYVVCAIDNHPIGVDIERIGEVDVFVAKKFFSLDEQMYIFSKGENPNVLFYKLWTLKECYSKYKGFGLKIPFSSFSFVIDDGNIKKEPREENLHFLSVIYETDYCLSVCTEERYELKEIKRLSIEDLMKI